MDDRQQRRTDADAEVMAARFVAMSPTTVARWAREGRSFRAVGARPQVEGDQGPAPGRGGDSPKP